MFLLFLHVRLRETVPIQRCTQQRFCHPSLGLLLALVLSAGLGCEMPSELVDAPMIVKGVDGQPIENAMVLAIPQRLRSELGWDLPYAYGRTDDQGKALLITEAGTHGLISGVYDVWIIERSEITSVQGSPSYTDVTYSKHSVSVGSRLSTPRIELRHDPVRVLEDVEIAQGAWAARGQLQPLVPQADDVELGGP